MTISRTYLTSRRHVSTDAAAGGLALFGAGLALSSTPLAAPFLAVSGAVLLGLEVSR